MTKEQLQKANSLKGELQILEHIKRVFNFDGVTASTKIRIGEVKKKGYALYTINNNHQNPVDEIILPPELKDKMRLAVLQLIKQKEKELEQL